MKKIMLKLKIFLTNISRIIYSFLFINVGSLFFRLVKADAVTLSDMEQEMTCYMKGPPKEPELTIPEKIIEKVPLNISEMFIILVPVVLIILFVIYIKIKGKKDETNDNKEED